MVRRRHPIINFATYSHSKNLKKMKRNSIIEMRSEYQTPCVMVVAFKSESLLLTQSQFGSGDEGYEECDFEVDF